MSSSSRAPGRPRVKAQGLAQRDPRGQRERGSKRGRRLVDLVGGRAPEGVVGPARCTTERGPGHPAVQCSGVRRIDTAINSPASRRC